MTSHDSVAVYSGVRLGTAVNATGTETRAGRFRAAGGCRQVMRRGRGNEGWFSAGWLGRTAITAAGLGDEMATLAFTRRGAGAPLVLLHGNGLSRRSWDPVLPTLAERFDVIAVDLPGFGESPPLPARVEPTPALLAAAVAGLLDELDISRPHLAGNSLGGWVALELARLRPVATVTLLSPAGLWRDRAPRYVRVSLRAIRWLSRHATGLLCGLANYRLGRVLVLGQTHGRPVHMTPDQARTTIRAMGDCPGFEAAFKASATRHYQADRPSDAPVTVAFGSRDLLFLRHQARHLDQLPTDAQVCTLTGCGHVPMGDAPAAVAALITASAGGGQRRTS